MNRFLQLVSLLILIIIAFSSYFIFKTHEENLKIMSYNIRYASSQQQDSLNYWDKRKDNVASVIRFYHADLVGLQEALKPQLDFLLKSLPQMASVGVARDDGKKEGEYSAILYSKEKFKLLKSETFWLSETPDTPSFGWGAACKRIVTWAKFEDLLTGNEFYHFNTHFDHESELARINSAKLLLNKINNIAGDNNVIITGDFNFLKSSEGYKILTDPKSNFVDSKSISKNRHYGVDYTFNGFGMSDSKNEIDFIFVHSDADVVEHAIIDDQFKSTYPSDHFPVMIEIVL